MHGSMEILKDILAHGLASHQASHVISSGLAPRVRSGKEPTHWSDGEHTSTNLTQVCVISFLYLSFCLHPSLRSTAYAPSQSKPTVENTRVEATFPCSMPVHLRPVAFKPAHRRAQRTVFRAEERSAGGCYMCHYDLHSLCSRELSQSMKAGANAVPEVCQLHPFRCTPCPAPRILVSFSPRYAGVSKQEAVCTDGGSRGCGTG